MSDKLQALLMQAAAGRRPGDAAPPAADMTAFVTALAAAIQDAARVAASEAVAHAPKMIVQPAPRTGWHFRVVRRDGLIEEIIAEPREVSR